MIHEGERDTRASFLRTEPSNITTFAGCVDNFPPSIHTVSLALLSCESTAIPSCVVLGHLLEQSGV